MSDTITEGIRIIVRPSFWAERSAPEAGQFAFSYAVQIANQGTAPAMLRTPFGTMRGSYTFERPDGSSFTARIGEFALTQPNALN
jgi:ApaG protein